MTKTELQISLAETTQTNKKTAALFLDTLSGLAYKAIRKKGEFVLPGFGKLVKQKRKARTGINPKTQEKIKIPAKTINSAPFSFAVRGTNSRIDRGTPNKNSSVKIDDNRVMAVTSTSPASQRVARSESRAAVARRSPARAGLGI